MRICIATCWDDDYLRRLAELSSESDSIYEVFGALPRGPTGTGRESGIVPAIERAEIGRHIELAHSLGIRFNYLMNGSCMAGLEYTRSGQDALAQEIRWVESVAADSVTVTVPFLVELVREVAPKLQIVISTIAHVDSVRAARAYRELGASRITVSLMVNRDFPLLRSMVEYGGCDVAVLANEMCLFGCPFRAYHYSLMSHGSLAGSGVCATDYPHMKCSLRRMINPGELLKARFIRPEDVAVYERHGIDLVKLAGRGRTAADLLRTAEAYLRRRYDGNLLDVTDLGLWGESGTVRPRLHIDNRALDGFLDRVTSVDCAHSCGSSCIFCDRLAEKVVTIHGSEAYTTLLDDACRRTLP